MYKLSADPDPELINIADDRGPHFYPFYNRKRKNDYNKLILPKSIDIIQNNLLGNKRQWFINKEHIFDYNKSKNINFTHNYNDTTPTDYIRMRKIKLILPKQTENIVIKWNNLYRFVYNKSVGIFNDTGLIGMSLRNCVKNNAQWGFHPYVLELPTELREGAANEVSTAAKTAFTNLSRNNISHFNIKFKKKTCKKWMLKGFQQRSYKKTGKKSFTLLNTYCPYQFYSTQKLPDKIENDFSLYFDGFDYYLLIPFTVNINTPVNLRNAISLDPGIRTFQTAYIPHEKKCIEICTGQSVAKLHSIAINLDRLISARKLGHFRNKNMKTIDRKSKKYIRKIISKRIQKTRKKLKNLQNELHWQTCSFLTNNCGIILCPILKVKSLSNKVNRKLSNKSVRNMSLLAHHSFRTKLKTKAEERGSTVIFCSEHYTSKTCGACGILNNNLGSNKSFRCQSCNFIIDRDVNAARNVMLRAMRGSADYDNDQF